MNRTTLFPRATSSLDAVRLPDSPFMFSICETNGESHMVKVNLHAFYPFYDQDCLIGVSDEVAAALQFFERQEASYQRRTRRYKAYYSLDREDGVEKNALVLPLSPEEIYEQKAARERLHAAVNALSGKQIKRIHAYFFLGMSIAEIAGREGVSRNVVRKSIRGGLKRLERILKNQE